jgi:hypothetical protein
MIALRVLRKMMGTIITVVKKRVISRIQHIHMVLIVIDLISNNNAESIQANNIKIEINIICSPRILLGKMVNSQ